MINNAALAAINGKGKNKMEIQEIQVDNLNNKLSAIDKALAAAKARKAAKEGSTSQESGEVAVSAPATKVSDEEKAQKLAARAAKQAQLKAEREARRVEKAATKAASKPAHMKKIDRAAGKLPMLNCAAQILFNEAITNFSAEQINAISQHLLHFNRVKSTERALSQKVESGTTVKIIAGDSRYVGMTGTVSKAQRIRCYVTVPGVKRDVYCFTSDVEIVATTQSSTGTEG